MIIHSHKLLFKNSTIEMLHKNNVIYKFENLIDGNIYIGKTVQELRVRIKQHLQSKDNYRFDNALRKYGIASFDIDVIAEADTEEELNALEMFFIEFYDCKNPNGYNLTDGGEGVSGFTFPPEIIQKIADKNRGRKHSKETRKKLSESLKGHPVSEETRKKLSISNIGKSHPISNETRQKLSETRPNKRKVICIETGEIFESLVAAAKWAGVTDTYMCHLCKGKKATGGGYHWRYADEEYNFVEKNPVQHKKQIICVETQQIFESAKDAAKLIGVSETSIRNACRGKSHSSGGYHWIYIDKTPTPKSKKVICLETGEIFESAAAAEKWLGVSEGAISKVCRGIYKTVKGYHWAFADSNYNDKIEPEPSHSKRVICVETNEIFEKIIDAAKWAGVGKNAIRRACRNEIYTAVGYHWKFADEEN